MATAKSLKIGFVLDDGLDKPDGVQQYIVAVGSWMGAQGHEVRYLVGETKRTDIPGVISVSRNMRWQFNGNRGTMPLPASRVKIQQLLQDEQFDVLHVQMPYSPFMAHKVILSAPLSTAVIGTYHIAPNSKLVIYGTKALGVWLRSSLRRFDTMLSVSPAAAAFAKQSFNIETSISPNVIDFPRFHKSKPLVEYDDDLPTILFLGRLVPRKGCMVLLQALQLMKQAGTLPECRVLICGRGPLEAKLKEFATIHNLPVTFVGFVSEDEKPRYYASADIAIFPSSGGESFGIVLLEAMASGNAVVLAGDNPGYRSVLHNNPELLFDPLNPQALAEKITLHMSNAKRSNQQRLWGVNFTKQFDIGIVGEQVESIYRDALQKRSKQ
ncbi:MAG: glycosyltransferase family 4 protein [Patescibacteria group bacterium]|nr:glycosyltransferase family 4 protein [Patescibacteria group bacterium]